MTGKWVYDLKEEFWRAIISVHMSVFNPLTPTSLPYMEILSNFEI